MNIGDFDGDGKPDLAIAHGSNPFMSVFRNISTTGNISFQAKVDFALTGGQSSTFISSSDLDGDGKLDIAVANYGSSTVSIFRNTATSGAIDASSFAAKVDFTTGGGPFSLAIGDLDGDSKPDLAVANETDNLVTVTHNPYVSVPTNVSGPANICMNNMVSLSATCAAGTTTAWYNLVIITIPGTPPTSLFVGSPFVSPSLTATTTYSVRCEQGAYEPKV